MRQAGLAAIQSRKPPTERYENIENVLDELLDVIDTNPPSVQLQALIEGFIREAEKEPRPPGGQQAGIDHCWALRVPPSMLKELRWYARSFKEELDKMRGHNG